MNCPACTLPQKETTTTGTRHCPACGGPLPQAPAILACHETTEDYRRPMMPRLPFPGERVNLAPRVLYVGEDESWPPTLAARLAYVRRVFGGAL